MPALPPAAGYRVTVTKTGFVKWTSEELKLATGETLNMRIQVHEPDTAAEVKESPLPGTETANWAVIEKLDQGRVLGIPTSSLRPDELALLAPAVSISPNGTLAFRANPFYNPLLVDGQDVTNRYYSSSGDKASGFPPRRWRRCRWRSQPSRWTRNRPTEE